MGLASTETRLHGLNTARWPNWQGRVLRIQQCKFESCTCLLIYFKFNKFSSAGTPSESRRSSVMMSLEAQFYKPIKQASKQVSKGRSRL
jgi:hypothetical protein